MGRTGTATKQPDYLKNYYDANKAKYCERNKLNQLKKKYKETGNDSELEKYGIHFEMFKDFPSIIKKMKDNFPDDYDKFILANV